MSFSPLFCVNKTVPVICKHTVILKDVWSGRGQGVASLLDLGVAVRKDNSALPKIFGRPQR